LREECRLRLSENRGLRRTFVSKGDEIAGKWRKLYSVELGDMYPPQNIFQVRKSRRNVWSGHVAQMGRAEVYTWYWWGRLREKDYLEEPGLDE